MTKPNQNPQSSTTPTYPDQTTGSKAAASVRSEGNNWSEAKRESLFKRGMQIIYGGSKPKEKVCSGH
jgi:hypothetical protein